MNDKKKLTWRGALGALLLVVAAGVVFAQSFDASRPGTRNADGKSPTSAQAWAYRENVTGTDSTTSTEGADPQPVIGADTYVAAFVRGSAPGAVAQLQCWVAMQDAKFDTIAGVRTVTITTSGNPNNDGYQTDGGAITFSVSGWWYYDIRVAGLTAGTMDVRAHTVGNGARVAQ